MPRRHSRRVRPVAAAVVSFALCGCSDGPPAVAPSGPPPPPTASLFHPDQLVAFAPGEGTTAARPFSVRKRSDTLTQFPCSACHERPLPPSDGGETARRTMHVDVELAHADDHVMDCMTCHNGARMDTLRLNDETAIGFDHAYRLCGQCHFQEYDDWRLGAHGKRLSGWAAERVVMNCSGCHDPHQPALGKRWPATYPRLPDGGDAH